MQNDAGHRPEVRREAREMLEQVRLWDLHERALAAIERRNEEENEIDFFKNAGNYMILNILKFLQLTACLNIFFIL